MPSFVTPLKLNTTMNETLSESVPTTDSEVRGKAKNIIAGDESIADGVFRHKDEKRFMEVSADENDPVENIMEKRRLGGIKKKIKRVESESKKEKKKGKNNESVKKVKKNKLDSKGKSHNVKLPEELCSKVEETNIEESSSGIGNAVVLESEETTLNTSQVVDVNVVKKKAFINMSQLSQSQCSASETFKDWILSQPPRNVSHKERMTWLQERRAVGVWVECCHSKCRKWRYLPHIHDPLELPKTWYCELNPDLKANNCNLKEHKLSALEEEDLLHSPYAAGSLVWAKLDGYPWWPAMVDDCPDTEQFYWLNGFSDIPTYYNVTFFDASTVTRAWILPGNLKPYAALGKKQKIQNGKVIKAYQYRLMVGMKQADDAMKLGILERLKKFSFISRYHGPINHPMKTNKKYKTLEDKQYESSGSSTDMGASDNEDADKDNKPLDKENIIVKTINLNSSQNNVVNTNTSEIFEISQNNVPNKNLNDGFDSCQVECESQLPVESEHFQQPSTVENDLLTSPKDAIVPSTQTNVNELTFDEEFETQMPPNSSPDFEMLIDIGKY